MQWKERASLSSLFIPSSPAGRIVRIARKKWRERERKILSFGTGFSTPSSCGVAALHTVPRSSDFPSLYSFTSPWNFQRFRPQFFPFSYAEERELIGGKESDVRWKKVNTCRHAVCRQAAWRWPLSTDIYSSRNINILLDFTFLSFSVMRWQ